VFEAILETLAELAERDRSAGIINSTIVWARYCAVEHHTISGFGLLAMNNVQVEAVLRGSFHYLAPFDSFYQFTYAMRCPVNTELLAELGLGSEEIGRSFRNVPPASVHKIQRHRPST